MIDRTALARQAELSSDQTEAAMVNALKALSLLRDAESLPQLQKLAKDDPNLRVREAARKALAGRLDGADESNRPNSEHPMARTPGPVTSSTP